MAYRFEAHHRLRDLVSLSDVDRGQLVVMGEQWWGETLPVEQVLEREGFGLHGEGWTVLADEQPLFDLWVDSPGWTRGVLFRAARTARHDRIVLLRGQFVARKVIDMETAAMLQQGSRA